MFENEVKAVLNGSVARVNISDFEKFMGELKNEWKFQAEILDAEDVLVEILNDEYLVVIPFLAIKNQCELSASEHLDCCGQLPENCNCYR